MKIVNVEDLIGTERDVHCPNGGFNSVRMLVKDDGMGFGMTTTFIPPNGWQHWHYTNHLEACYCISGKGLINDLTTGLIHEITPGVIYALDNHDDHLFKALEDTVLICVFNPPLTGKELHGPDGSYASGEK